jgi:hypothetical protein
VGLVTSRETGEIIDDDIPAFVLVLPQVCDQRPHRRTIHCASGQDFAEYFHDFVSHRIGIATTDRFLRREAVTAFFLCAA